MNVTTVVNIFEYKFNMFINHFTAEYLLFLLHSTYKNINTQLILSMLQAHSRESETFVDFREKNQLLYWTT